MGNFAAHVWTITITFIIAIVALLVWYFGYADLNNTLYADNLQDATRTALYAAQDKADRTERGTFVINKKVFDTVLGNTSVRQFGGKPVAGMNHTRIYFIPDTEKADERDSSDNATTGSKLKDPQNDQTLGSQDNGQDNSQLNNHNVSTGSKYKEGTNETQPWIKAYDSDDDTEEPLHKSDDVNSAFEHQSNDYETIRGVRVVVDGPTPSNLGFNSDNALNHEANDNNYNYNSKKGFHGNKAIPDKSTDKSTVDSAKDADNYNGNGSDDKHVLTQFTATDIIQTFGKNASNDTYNDLTR